MTCSSSKTRRQRHSPVLWCCWLGGGKGIRPVERLSGGMLAWLSVWDIVQICIWPSWCHCHSPSLVSVKSRLFLVPAHPGNPRQSPEGHKMDVCVCVLVQRLELSEVPPRRSHSSVFCIEHRCSCTRVSAGDENACVLSSVFLLVLSHLTVDWMPETASGSKQLRQSAEVSCVFTFLVPNSMFLTTVVQCC